MPLRKILADPQLSRLILDQAFDAFVAIDEHSTILEWNRQAELTFGWRRDDILGLRLTETIVPERYRAAHHAGLQRYLRTGESKMLSSRIELFALRKDGSEIPVELSVIPIAGADRPIFAASIRDLSERRALERGLQRQIDITRSIVESMADAVAVADSSEQVTLINPAARRLWNMAPSADVCAVSQLGHNLYQPDGQTACPAAEQPLARALRGERVSDWVGLILHEQGPGVWIRANARPLMGSDGTQVGAVAVYHDITALQQRHQALMQQANLLRSQVSAESESALTHTRDRYRLLVETATEFAMIVTDPEGNIVSWNTGAEHILGLSSDEVMGRSISSIFPPEDQERGHPWQELENSVAAGRAEDMRWHTRKDGSRFWASGVVTPLWGTRGQLLGFTKILRDQTAQRLAEEQMQFLANHDPLTGLPNRVHLSDELHRAIALSNRNGTPFAMLALDLDRFKYVNDTFGHHIGDVLLTQVAQRLLSSLRETDFTARLGGDEFVVVQTAAQQPQAATALAEKLTQELGRTYRLEQHDVEIGASIGIALYPADAGTTVDLMKRADAALYCAKSAGRGQYRFHAQAQTTATEPAASRKNLLRSALTNNELRLYYQPQIDLRSWRMCSVEALLRWQAGDRELLLPADFLALAESDDLIVEIGHWVLHTACRQVKQWQERLPDLRVTVNCSPRQCGDTRFSSVVLPALQDTGLAHACLEFEVTESVLAQPEVKNQLSRLRALGVRITVDNYGTGPTTWSELKDMEVDGLKIDRQLIQHLPHRQKDAALALALIQLARNLGISVGAGGVETPEQLAYLKAQECGSAQGFIFSPPVSAEAFEQLMMSGRWSRINPPGEANQVPPH